MGIWAEIKHALNSTLGTDKFVPLNEVYDRQIRLCASDSVKEVIHRGSVSFAIETPQSISIIKLLKPGTVRIKFNGYNNGLSTTTVGIHIYVNNKFVGSNSIEAASRYNFSVATDVSVNEYDILEVRAASRYSTIITNANVLICCDSYISPINGILEVNE